MLTQSLKTIRGILLVALGFSLQTILHGAYSGPALVFLDSTSTSTMTSQTVSNRRTKTSLAATIPNSTAPFRYVPAPAEKYIMDHLIDFGWDSVRNPSGCGMWTDPGDPLYADLQLYLTDLQTYLDMVQNFSAMDRDLRESLRAAESGGVCDRVRLGPNGLPGIFSASGQLSLSSSGYVEPLTTPMRHPLFCVDEKKLMDINYFVHDFEAMCRKLRPHSRTILIDMGASLSYHNEQDNPLLHVSENPMEHILKLYAKFGIHFDHIYGFEAKFTDPKDVFQRLLPEQYMAAYHWINAGIESTGNGRLNPMYSILRHFDKDDVVVVKLDIDTASIELPLAKQLLEDDRLHTMIDQFYFEHHVHMAEMAKIWRSAMKGSLKETFDLFFGLRQRGVPAHFWV